MFDLMGKKIKMIFLRVEGMMSTFDFWIKVKEQCFVFTLTV